MNTEVVKILKVKTEGEVKTIGELRDNIKALKGELSDLEIGSEAYDKTLQELSVNQLALKEAMNATNASMADAYTEVTGVTESYNSLRLQMSDLQKQLKNTDISTEEGKQKFAGLAAEINGINDKLKAMDAMQGNYQRNVGNYGSAIDGLADSFKKTAGSAGSIINPLKGMTAGLKTLSATPVIAILGILAQVIAKVMESMKKSEDATGALTKAFAGFGAITEVITTVLTKVGNAIAFVIEGVAKLTTGIFGLNGASEKRAELAQKQLDLAKKERETLRQNADATLEVAKLREKASDKEKYTATERIAFMKKAGELENEISKRAVEDLRTQYEIIKAKNALGKSTAEELQQEADAYAAMVRAETDYFNKVTTNNKALTRLRKEELKAAVEAATERQESIMTQINAEKEMVQQELDVTEKGTDDYLNLLRERRKLEYKLAVEEAKSKISNAKNLHTTLLLLEKKYNKDLLTLQRENEKERESQSNLHLQNVANAYEKGTLEYLTAIRDLRKQELEQIQKEEGETTEQYNARRLAAQKAYYDSIRDLNAKHLSDSTIQLREALSKQREGTEGYYAGMAQLAQSNYEHLQRLAGESDEEFAIRQNEAYIKSQDAQKAYLDYLDSQEELHLENKMNSFEEGTVQYANAEVELRKWQYEQVLSIGQLESESEEEFNARKLEAEKNYTSSKKALIQQQIALAQGAASSISGLFSSMADMYESDEKNAKKNAKKIKGLRIAGATIDMLNGVVTAISQAQSLGPILGPIMAAINSASVIAAGTANINKIKSTDESGNSSEAAAVTSAPSVTTDVSMVRTVTSASEEARLDQMASSQRVYILASDIEASQNQIKTTVEETTF